MAPLIYKNKDFTVVYDQRGIKKSQLRRIPQLKGDIANVVYNDLDLSRFPNLRNDIVLKKLKQGHSLTELIIDEIDLRQHGGFINYKALWRGPRQGPSPALRKFMDEHGDEAIVDLRLSRQPLSNYLTRFLDVLSLGKFSKKVKDLGYDAAYHTGVEVTTNKGTYLIERNHILEAKDMKKRADKVAGEDPNMVNIEAKIPENLTIRAMIDNAAKENKNFWRYDPVSNNCQVLVQDLLDKNNIDHNDELIVQDAKELYESAGPARRVLPGLTDTAALLDTVIHGEGRKKRKGRARARV